MRRVAPATGRNVVDRGEATAGRPGWVLIENEGALFRGFSRGNPQEVWSPHRGWSPYVDAGEYKPIEWGEVISEEDAFRLMSERETRRLREHESEPPIHPNRGRYEDVPPAYSPTIRAELRELLNDTPPGRVGRTGPVPWPIRLPLR